MKVEIIVGIVLGIQSYWDIKGKCIPSVITAVGGIIGIIMSIYTERSCVDICMALLPGISLLIIGKLSKEAIGYGDGLLICMIGLFYSLEKVMSIGLIAFSFVAVVALMMLVLWKKGRNYTIPFVPFLLFGWGVNFVLSKGSIWL